MHAIMLVCSGEKENLMSELETKSKAEEEEEDFTDELSDEALDREHAGVMSCVCPNCSFCTRRGEAHSGN